MKKLGREFLLLVLGIGVVGLILVGIFVWPGPQIVENSRQATLPAQAMVAGEVSTPTPMPTRSPADKPTSTPTTVSTNTPTASPSATSYSPTSAILGSSMISSTVNVTSTSFVSGTANGLVHPVFFEGQSSGKQFTASYDVGVKGGQCAIVFGYGITWKNQTLGGPSDPTCALVILLPGWYEALTLTDGRYEVYDLPSSQQEWWIKDLARQRAEEQTNHYGCALKVNVPIWKSGVSAVVWNIVVPPAVMPTLTVAPTISSTITTVKSGTSALPTATPNAQARVRTQSGKGGTANFVKGDEVMGWAITLDSGQKCEGGCYLPVAPGSGVVKDGVVNPWKEELKNAPPAWTPS